jgi:hypothetical protein
MAIRDAHLVWGEVATRFNSISLVPCLMLLFGKKVRLLRFGYYNVKFGNFESRNGDVVKQLVQVNRSGLDVITHGFRD